MSGRTIRRYQALIEVAAVLARTRRTDDVVRAVHAEIGKLFTAPVTLLGLHRPDRSWHCRTLEGDEAFESELPPRADGLLERAMNGTLGVVDDVVTYSEQHGFTVRRLRSDDPKPIVRSWIGAPLSVNGTRLGVLSLQSYDTHAFTDGDLQFLHALAQHVSIAMENALLREQLEQQALTDALTFLPNRRAFEEAATKAIARARRSRHALSLAMLDVQNFKRINDHFGHATGDLVLQRLALHLQQHLREDDAAFRLGGDEFAILLWGDEHAARTALARLDQCVRESAWPEPVTRVRLNAGVAQYGTHPSLDAWLREADERMYAAKAEQRLLNDA